MKIKTKVSHLTLALGLLLTPTAFAAPWIDTEDRMLRISVQALADANVIKRPVNTYPLMWKGIAADIAAFDEKEIPAHALFAYYHVKHSLRFAKSELTMGVKLQATNDVDGFQYFGERYDSDAQVSAYTEVVQDGWAGKLQVNYRSGTNEKQELTYDGSYAAANIGNLVISADIVNNWWGPGKSNALIMSNNARAFPAIRLTRHTSEAFESKWLSWIGPWSATTYIGAQENNAAVPNTKLWGARVNFRPIDSLEIGLSRTAQWGGDGRSEGIDDLWNVIIGKDNRGDEISAAEEPGNQLAGVDVRYSFSAFGMRGGVYGEFIGEDEAGLLPSHIMSLVGTDWYFGDNENLYQAYIEYTDTFVDCGFGGVAGNCAYEHHIFKDGYRRYGRSMGSTYDSDANVVTLGLTQHFTGGYGWFGKLHWMQLNKDNSNSSRVDHPLSKVAVERLQFDAGVQFPLFKGLTKVSGYVYHQKEDVSKKSETEAAFRLSWEYRY